MISLHSQSRAVALAAERQRLEQKAADLHDRDPTRPYDDVVAQVLAEESPEEEKTQSDQPSLLHQDRDKLLQALSRGHQECAIALEAVSLLLTEHNSAAKSTISPYLHQTLPLICLAAEKVDSELPEHVSTDNTTAGWHMQALQSAAEQLTASAVRLEQDIAQETRYWAEIMHIKQAGWAVARMQGDSRVLGIALDGMVMLDTELTSAHRTAALRRLPSGEVQLDYHKDRRRLCVSLFQGKSCIGTNSSSPSKTSGLEAELHAARDGLFDQELFRLCQEEAGEYGLSLNPDNSIRLPFWSHQTLRLSLAEDTDGDNLTANMVATVARLLLCHRHTETRGELSQRPQALGAEQKARKRRPILLPLVQLIEHRRDIEQVLRYAQDWAAVLQLAGLSCSYEVTSNSPNITEPNFLALLTTSTIKISLGIESTTQCIQLQRNAEGRFSGCGGDLDTGIARMVEGRIYELIRTTIPRWHGAAYDERLACFSVYDAGQRRRDTMVVSLSRSQLTLKRQVVAVGCLDKTFHVWSGTAGPYSEARSLAELIAY